MQKCTPALQCAEVHFYANLNGRGGFSKKVAKNYSQKGADRRRLSLRQRHNAFKQFVDHNRLGDIAVHAGVFIKAFGIHV